MDIDKEEEALAAGLDQTALIFHKESATGRKKAPSTVCETEAVVESAPKASFSGATSSRPPSSTTGRRAIEAKPVSSMAKSHSGVGLTGVDSIVVCHEQPDVLTATSTAAGGRGKKDGRKLSASSQSMSI